MAVVWHGVKEGRTAILAAVAARAWARLTLGRRAWAALAAAAAAAAAAGWAASRSR
jgi:hypothetical protein